MKILFIKVLIQNNRKFKMKNNQMVIMIITINNRTYNKKLLTKNIIQKANKNQKYSQNNSKWIIQ